MALHHHKYWSSAYITDIENLTTYNSLTRLFWLFQHPISDGPPVQSLWWPQWYIAQQSRSVPSRAIDDQAYVFCHLLVHCSGDTMQLSRQKYSPKYPWPEITCVMWNDSWCLRSHYLSSWLIIERVRFLVVDSVNRHFRFCVYHSFAYPTETTSVPRDGRGVARREMAIHALYLISQLGGGVAASMPDAISDTVLLAQILLRRIIL